MSLATQSRPADSVSCRHVCIKSRGGEKDTKISRLLARAWIFPVECLASLLTTPTLALRTFASSRRGGENDTKIALIGSWRGSFQSNVSLLYSLRYSLVES